MEPLDPVKNVEGNGCSKRRISSILKAPRKSLLVQDFEQQENEVESAKQAEKRNSRRVSFAPANDVLLFAKDVKNARSPLQELLGTAPGTTPNRVHVVATEDTSPHIIGIDTLLNAPLHASQQKLMVPFDNGNDFGEKTVMFSTEDATMDMTHSHTINIKSDAELLGDDVFTDLPADNSAQATHQMSSADKKAASATLPLLDPGFNDFLSSLSRQSTSSTNAVLTGSTLSTGPSFNAAKSSLAQSETQSFHVDKENQVPKSLSSSSRDIGIFLPEDHVSMDMTEAQNSRTLTASDDDDPFQCLFPTQEMYATSEKQASQAKEIKNEPSAKNLKSDDQQAKTFVVNPFESICQNREIGSLFKNECREETIGFTANEFMAITQSHTGSITCSSLPRAPKSAGNSFDPRCMFPLSPYKTGNCSGNPENPRIQPITASSFKQTVSTEVSLSQHKGPRKDIDQENFPLSSSKGCTEPVCLEGEMSRDMREVQTGRIIGGDISMDMTEVQTGCIDAGPGSEDLFQFLIPSQGVQPVCKSQKKEVIALSEEDVEGQPSTFKGMETSVLPLNVQLQKHQDKIVLADDYREKTLRFSADDVHLDVTRSHTVYIATNIELAALQNVNMSPACGEKTVRFDAGDAAMDMTQCLTRNIATNLASDLFPQTEKSQDPKSTANDCSSHRVVSRIKAAADAFMVFQEDDMDITEPQTGCMLGPEVSMNVGQTGRIVDTPQEHEAPQAVVTTQEMHCQSHHGSSNLTGTKTPLKTIIQRHQIDFDSKHGCGEKTVRFAVDDGCMDVIQCNMPGDLTPPCMGSSAIGERTIRFNTNDAEMDVTKCHTVNMRDLHLQSFPNLVSSANGEKTVRFNYNDATMDVTKSHTVDIAHDLNVLLHKSTNLLPGDGEPTRKFGADDAEMDVTKSHTVNIMRELPVQSPPNAVLSSNGEKTARFSASDAAMDVTRSHTVRISTHFKMPSNQNDNLATAGGEKTVRFATNEATMDVTRSHTVDIAHDSNLLTQQKLDFLPGNGEKTVRFSVTDAEMDLTKSLRVKIFANSNVAYDEVVGQPPADKENPARLATNNASMDLMQNHSQSITTDFDQIMDGGIINESSKAQHDVNPAPRTGDKTTRFTTSDATMDITHCLSVNIVSNELLDPSLSNLNAEFVSENPSDTVALKKTDGASSAQSGHAVINHVQGKAEGDAPSCPDSYSLPTTKKPDTDAENESPSFVSDVGGKPVNKTETDSGEISVSMDVGEDQAKRLVSSADNPPEGASSIQDPCSKMFKGALGSTTSDEIDDVKEYRCEAQTEAVSQNMESSPSIPDRNDAQPSRISRRKSLADLQSKVRRLSQLINAAPDAAAAESCTAPLLNLEPCVEKTSNDKTSSASAMEPVLETETEASVATDVAPFSLKTKQLMSRLSVGGFKAKLPKRNTADESRSCAFRGDPTRTFTVSVTNQLRDFDQIAYIQDEELVDCEDLSETIDTATLQKLPKKESAFDDSHMFQSLEADALLDDFMPRSQGQKRSLPENEDDKEEEKRWKMCTEFAESADVDGDSSMATAHTETIDSSSSIHAGSRCEMASESTFKHSLFESQLENYASDGQKKLEDGTISALEFFNLFNIDFVIHKPRQSVLPGRLLDSAEATRFDLLKDNHISRPKQMVYQTDVQTLTEKVEGLKYRIQDLDKPLKIVNRSLWKEMQHFTEKELKSFGAKLKERNNVFRKNSKLRSHERKEVLYANLVLANQEEQQKLRGTISQADEMIRTLDSCVAELEAELDAVEEKGSEDKPSLKSLQEEMSKVNESLADRERQISELDLGNKKNWSNLKRLKTEELNLQGYIDTLNMVNEWRLEEKEDDNNNCSVYSFLYRTLFLQLEFEQTRENDADSGTEKKITKIRFNFNLSDEKSQCHARLVHTLVSQYMKGESSWVQKYPTSRHVPMLLNDVSLVVSRSRLVGEELRLLKMWGSLRFDILDISCSETLVCIVFSSLKKHSKFEVIFAARLTNQLCVFHVQSFKNLIGSTTIQQIEEVVASLSPGKNLFTRIVRKLHETLLS